MFINALFWALCLGYLEVVLETESLWEPLLKDEEEEIASPQLSHDADLVKNRPSFLHNFVIANKRSDSVPKTNP